MIDDKSPLFIQAQYDPVEIVIDNLPWNVTADDLGKSALQGTGISAKLRVEPVIEPWNWRVRQRGHARVIGLRQAMEVKDFWNLLSLNGIRLFARITSHISPGTTYRNLYQPLNDGYYHIAVTHGMSDPSAMVDSQASPQSTIRQPWNINGSTPAANFSPPMSFPHFPTHVEDPRTIPSNISSDFHATAIQPMQFSEQHTLNHILPHYTANPSSLMGAPRWTENDYFVPKPGYQGHNSAYRDVFFRSLPPVVPPTHLSSGNNAKENSRRERAAKPLRSPHICKATIRA